MKLSSKIYLVIALLSAVAVVILLLSIFSMRGIIDNMAQSNIASGMTNTLNNADKVLLRRIIATQNILIADTDQEMQAIHTSNFEPTERQMPELIKQYYDFHAPWVEKAEWDKRRDLLNQEWNAFVKETDTAVDLSMQNTNNKALDINKNMIPMWADLEKNLDKLEGDIHNGAGGFATAMLAEHLSKAKTDMLKFRLFTLDMIYEPDQTILARLIEDKKVLRQSIEQNLGELVNRLAEPARDTAVVVLKRLKEESWPGYESIVPLALSDSNARGIVHYNTKGVEAQKVFDSYSEELIKSAAYNEDRLQREAAVASRRAITIMTVVGIIGIALGIIIAVFVIRALIRVLNNVIASLGDSSTQVNAAAGQISGASQSLAEGSTEQAASLEETSSALEEMASMTRQNADNANKTNDTNKQNNELISEGAVAVANMSTAMSEINDSAEKIHRIIKTIEDIAFQTNLLALNAAVEAARAGEAGKGFAVVADEVRNLAGRSAQAARDTTELIEGTVLRVKNGSDIASRLNTSFKQIEEGSTDVSRLITQIAAATTEQAQGVDQVNTAVAQMDKVTQQNAANAEETASASEELSAQAQALNGIVGDLIDIVQGTGARQDGIPAPGARQSARPGAAASVRRANFQSNRMKSLPPPQPASTPGGSNRVMRPDAVIPLEDGDIF